MTASSSVDALLPCLFHCVTYMRYLWRIVALLAWWYIPPSRQMMSLVMFSRRVIQSSSPDMSPRQRCCECCEFFSWRIVALLASLPWCHQDDNRSMSLRHGDDEDSLRLWPRDDGDSLRLWHRDDIHQYSERDTVREVQWERYSDSDTMKEIHCKRYSQKDTV